MTLASTVAVTLRSSPGLSLPPRACHRSGLPFPPGCAAETVGRGRTSAYAPWRCSAAIARWPRSAVRTEPRSRCSSCTSVVHAVTRYRQSTRGFGGPHARTPSSSTNSIPASRSSVFTRTSHRNRLTVGFVTPAPHSLSGGWNETSTWRAGRDERGGQRGGADRPAGDPEPMGEEVEIDLLHGGPGREGQPPDGAPLVFARHRELHHDVDPAEERLVHVPLQVRRHDRDAVVGLEPLQQVGDLDVRVPVVCVADVRALPEQRVGLVEEQHEVSRRGTGEDPLEVLLGLTDVLAHHAGEVDLVEVQAELARNHSR